MKIIPFRNPLDDTQWLVGTDLEETPIGRGTIAQGLRDILANHLLDKHPQSWRRAADGRPVLNPSVRAAQAEITTQIMRFVELLSLTSDQIERPEEGEDDPDE